MSSHLIVTLSSFKRSNKRLQKLGGTCVGLFMFKEYCKCNPRVLDPLFKYQRLLRKVLAVDEKRWQAMTERRILFIDKQGRPLDIYEITQAMAEETGCPDDALYEKRFALVRQYTDLGTLMDRKEAEECDMKAEIYCEELVLNVEDVVVYDGRKYESRACTTRQGKVNDHEDPLIAELKQKNPNDLTLKQLKMLVKPPKVIPAGSDMGFGMTGTKFSHEQEIAILKKYVRISYYSKHGKKGYVHNSPLGTYCCNNKLSTTKEKALALVLRNHSQNWRDEVLLFHTS